MEEHVNTDVTKILTFTLHMADVAMVSPVVLQKTVLVLIPHFNFKEICTILEFYNTVFIILMPVKCRDFLVKDISLFHSVKYHAYRDFLVKDISLFHEVQ